MAQDMDSPDELVPGTTAEELYIVIRKAIEDAMLHVIGTIVVILIALSIVGAGAAVFWNGPDPAGPVIGSVVILFGFYLAAVTLGVIRPIRDWF